MMELDYDELRAEIKRLRQERNARYNDLEIERCARQNAEAEIERLRAIVDRLPKTADGVPVVSGMTIWNSGIHTGTSELIGDLTPVAENYGSSQWKDGMIDADKCYSTREAAEAARTEGN